MLFWKSWFDKKIFFIQDILSGDGNFLTFEEFQNKFRIKTNYLHYFQLMATIPSDLKKKAMSAEVPSHEQLLYSTMVSLSPENTLVDLANMRIIINCLTRILPWSQPASKPGKYILPTNIQNGKRNFHSYIIQKEIITYGSSHSSFYIEF